MAGHFHMSRKHGQHLAANMLAVYIKGPSGNSGGFVIEQ
jgi:hypothetical protein